jgi:hypothetical protein
MNEIDINLLPPNPHVQGTGAIFRPPSVKDYQLLHRPSVREAMADLPSSFLVLPIDKIKTKYDQGMVPSCVAYSTCGAKSIEDFTDNGLWNTYDGDELYRACGGNGAEGISTDTALAYARDTGCLSAGKRWPIESYAFAPMVAGAWRRTLAAALVASGPCVVAALLPVIYGWDSNQTLSGAYHQQCLIGWDGLDDNDHAIFLNSWSSRWGNLGCGRMTWAYLEGNNFQGSYCYGFQITDFHEAIEPPPDPIVKPVEFDATVKAINDNVVKIKPAGVITGLAQDDKIHVKKL